MKELNKLVRDKIPEIIVSQGKKITLRKVDKENKVIPSLLEKLDEEIAELKEAYSDFSIEQYDNDIAENVIEEMADVLEVLYGLCYHTKITKMLERVTTKRKQKNDERGGFEKMFFVESVEE